MFSGVFCEVFQTVKNGLVKESIAYLAGFELTRFPRVGFDDFADGYDVGVVDADQLLKGFGGQFEIYNSFEGGYWRMGVVKEGVLAEHKRNDGFISIFGGFGLELHGRGTCFDSGFVELRLEMVAGKRLAGICVHLILCCESPIICRPEKPYF